MADDPGRGGTTPTTSAVTGRSGRLGPSEVLFLVVLALVSVAVRLPAITAPPLEFHPTRQYRSALYARYLTSQVRPDAVPVSEEVASASHSGTYEPPVMESLAAASFIVAGSEPLWFVRLLSVAAWTGVALVTYLLARRLAGLAAAIVAAAFVALTPFTVFAARSIQPEPLMTLLMVVGLLATVRYDEEPTRRRLVLASVAAAAAVLVKPMCVFILAGAFGALAIRRHGLRGIVSRPTITYGLSMVVVGGLWVSWAMFGTEAIAHVPDESPSRALVTSWAYWQGWSAQLDTVVGTLALVLAIAGAVVAPGRSRVLLAGCAAGYLAYGAYFAFQIHTHDYYSLLIVPVVALGLGHLAAWALTHVRSPEVRRAIGALGAVALVLVAAHDVQRARRYPVDRLVAQARELGEASDHTTDALILAPAYGHFIRYHGGLSAEPWPYPYDDEREQIQGQEPTSGGEHLDARIDETGAELFLVADLPQLDRYGSLRRELEDHHTEVARGSDWIIYDLR